MDNTGYLKNKYFFFFFLKGTEGNWEGRRDVFKQIEPCQRQRRMHAEELRILQNNSEMC